MVIATGHKIDVFGPCWHYWAIFFLIGQLFLEKSGQDWLEG